MKSSLFLLSVPIIASVSYSFPEHDSRYSGSLLRLLSYSSISITSSLPRRMLRTVLITTIRFMIPSMQILSPSTRTRTLPVSNGASSNNAPTKATIIAIMRISHHLLIPNFFASIAVWIFKAASTSMKIPMHTARNSTMCSVLNNRTNPRIRETIPSPKSY